MTVTPEQIEAAKKYLTNVEHLAAACDRFDLPFYVGCTILQKETGGLNIYGHDKGGVFTVSGRKEVTEENFAEFRRRIDAGETSNGVGPMQITWKGFFPDAEKKGFKLWLPEDNIAYGVSILARYWKSSSGNMTAVGTAYNGGAAYGAAAASLAKIWKERVGTDDLLPPPPPEPDPPTGDPIIDMIRSLPLKHSTTPPADYVSVKGASGNPEHILPLDLEIILRCAVAVGWGPVTVIKGGLEGTNDLSASTHAFFGVADIRTRGHDLKQCFELVGYLHRSGIVGFLRGLGGGDSFDPHLHIASREAGKLAHESLRRQISEFQDGGDGLRGSREYFGPSVRLATWAQSPLNPANISVDTGMYRVTTDGDRLLGVDVDRRIKTRIDNGTVIAAARRVQRWDRSNVVVDDGSVNGLYFAAEYLEAVTVVPDPEPQPEETS